MATPCAIKGAASDCLSDRLWRRRRRCQAGRSSSLSLSLSLPGSLLKFYEQIPEDEPSAHVKCHVLPTRGLPFYVCLLWSSKLCSRLWLVVHPALHAHVLTTLDNLFRCFTLSFYYIVLVLLLSRFTLSLEPTHTSFLLFSIGARCLCDRESGLSLLSQFLVSRPRDLAPFLRIPGASLWKLVW